MKRPVDISVRFAVCFQVWPLLSANRHPLTDGRFPPPPERPKLLRIVILRVLRERRVIVFTLLIQGSTRPDIVSLVGCTRCQRELFQISQTKIVRVFVTVPEEFPKEIGPGTKATTDLTELPKRRFAATVTRTTEAIDANSRPLTVELDVSRCAQFPEIRSVVFNPFPGLDCIVTALKSRIVVHKTPTKFLLKFVRDISNKMTLTFLRASLSVRDLSTARHLSECP
jgi:hypothetical protein